MADFAETVGPALSGCVNLPLPCCSLQVENYVDLSQVRTM